MTPTITSGAPITRNTDPLRARMVRARRVIPMTASSAPVRNHHRIRLGRVSRVTAGTPYRSAGPPDGLQTIRLRRCDRIFITSLPSHRKTKAACVRVPDNTPPSGSRARQLAGARVLAGLRSRDDPLRVRARPSRLRRTQYRPGLIDGFLAKTRLDLS